MYLNYQCLQNNCFKSKDNLISHTGEQRCSNVAVISRRKSLINHNESRPQSHLATTNLVDEVSIMTTGCGNVSVDEV